MQHRLISVPYYIINHRTLYGTKSDTKDTKPSVQVSWSQQRQQLHLLVTCGCYLCYLWVLPVVVCVQATLQVGGHGERLHQCKEVTLTTFKSIPMQVDGEPCKLAPSVIHINLRNQANMVQKAKRRISMPHLNE